MTAYEVRISDWSSDVCASDLLPENYEKHMDAFQFIKDVPTDWEESVALDGAVGEYVAIARKQRGGQEWFLGALTDENPRTLALKLDFLDPGKRYRVQLYRSEEHTSELQSLMRISYAVFCLKKKNNI